ncbi:MAG: 3-deoxy-manno-octulosonate cytidylyltransferase [Flavobacteriales bacterium]|nr:3-deoxy-manno-octulosonate cytidylyltransferase [Flavobacteriales bacterium]|tara:strand:- start:574 stop:1305 length:732 start_codon:yes stop_codon:yes gene_type:complete
MRILGIIPSRYNSSRFPGKPLANILGKSMIQRVYDQSQKCNLLNKVVVATDDERISFHVKSFGGNVMMTSKNHKSGTDRCGEVIRKLEEYYDIVVNIQGDEPFINPNQITQLLKMFENTNIQIASLARKIDNYETYSNINIVKVFFDEKNIVKGFERESKLNEEDFENYNTYKHIGIYAFRTNILNEIIDLNPTENEKKLNLEQLRWIENKYSIHIGITEIDSLSVDKIEDIEKISEFHLKND